MYSCVYKHLLHKHNLQHHLQRHIQTINQQHLNALVKRQIIISFAQATMLECVWAQIKHIEQADTKRQQKM